MAATDYSEASFAAAALHSPAAAAAINATQRTDARTRPRAWCANETDENTIQVWELTKKGKRRQGHECKDTGCRER